MLIVGATCTWNAIDNIEKVAESLRATCDVTMAFDDGSDDGTRELLPKLFNVYFSSTERAPELLTMRRALLYAEAERLGAKWFIYHDHDEAFSLKLRMEMKEILANCEEHNQVALIAPLIQFWGDTRHRMVKRRTAEAPEGEMPCEIVAWRANVGFSYYPNIQLAYKGRDTNAIWHAPRAPQGAHQKDRTAGIEYPWGALLHYGNVPEAKAVKRREWAKSIGMDNIYYDPPAEGELVEIEEAPEWDQPVHRIILP